MNRMMNKIKLVSVFVITTLFSGLSVMAADTEIFFAPPTETTGKPNVLFILNTSGTFNGSVDDVPAFCGTGVNKQFSVMQCIMSRFIETNDQLNIGFMRYNNPAGPISYPVRDPTTPADASNLPPVITQLSGTGNDILQTTTPLSHDNSSTSMILGEVGKVAAFRFENVSIPQGATVTKAVIRFVASDSIATDETTAFNLSISVEKPPVASPAVLADSAAFDTAPENVSDRDTTGTTTTWSITATDTWSIADGDNGVIKSSADFSGSLNPLIQDISWCGENSLSVFFESSASSGTRTIATYDTDPSLAPTLYIEWDDSTIDALTKGCYLANTSVTIASAADDDEDVTNESSVLQLSLDTTDLDFADADDRGDLAFPVSAIGLLFRDVNIPKDAKILSAHIITETTSSRQSANFSTNISAIQDPTFDEWIEDFSNTSTGTSSETWDQNNDTNGVIWARNTTIQSPDIASVIDEIVSDSNWIPGTSTNIPLVLKSTATDRRIKSTESNSPARLIISYMGNYTRGTNTIAPEMIAQITDFVQTGNQATIDTYLEAYRYFKGSEIMYGGSRHNDTKNRISHPLAYNSDLDNTDSATKLTKIDFTPDSYEVACTDDYPTNTRCSSEKIVAGTETPTYKSPMEHQCQSNHIVLLVDGSPSPIATTAGARTETVATINSLSGKGTCGANELDQCGFDFAEYLASTDIDTTLPEDQFINTHAIQFGLLTDQKTFFPFNIAKAGGGEYFEARSGADLVIALEDLSAGLGQVDTSFVAAGITVSQSNRLTHRDELYFSLFKPKPVASWPGNVKRYRIFDGEILDNSPPPDGPIPAIIPGKDIFKDDARSYWSVENDGNNAGEGGAASQLDFSSVDRVTFSNLTGNSGITFNSNSGLNQLNDTNNHPSTDWDTLLGTFGADTTETLQWIMGFDDNGVSHNIVGDPLHSKPTILSYRKINASGDPELTDMVFVGTNHGFLHAFLTETGVEQWSFIPQELLTKVNDYLEPVQQDHSDHQYGVDGSIEIYIDDRNNNGAVDEDDVNEKAYLYVGLRRGGHSYYAFDITDKLNPELMFVIDRGNFPELGETWSTPQIAKLADSSQADGFRLVMVFGGGYDTNQDPTDAIPSGGAPSLDGEGRTIYIADALTGAKIWDARSDAIEYKQAGLKTLMNSIPGDVKLVNISHRNYFDHIYAADTLGQVFRYDFDLNWDGGSADTLAKGGMLAEIQTADNGAVADVDCATDTCNRRFYYSPDIAFIQRASGSFVSVAIGSGYRAHPLGTENEDAFYVIRDTGVLRPELTEKYTGTRTGFSSFDNHDGSVDNVTGEPDIFGDPGSEVIKLANLVDITSYPSGTTAVDLVESTSTPKAGWILALSDGEKVLASSVTFNNSVIFTTYIPPDANENICGPGPGDGRVYSVSVVDGTPTIYNNDNPLESDRWTKLNNLGIPPTPQIIVLDTGAELLIGRQLKTDLLGEGIVGKMIEMQKWRERNSRPTP